MNIDEKYFQESQMQVNRVEDILAVGEDVLWRDKPDKKAHVAAAIVKALPFTIVWILFDFGFIIGIAIAMSKGAIPLAILGFIIPFFLIHLTPVWIWIVNIVRSVAELKNLEYVFTDKRIIVRSGIIGIDFKSLYYNEVESVNVNVNWTDKIFKVGDIYVNAKSSAAVLYDLHNPYILGTKLQKIVQDITTDINYPNALRPDNNPGYHTKYTDDPFKR
ncbi:MAG: PH domain-containing protein [Bacteroides sp.]|nr:PH domain-containing protein [Bacillota bacterium]MCM1393296.1 PH domain-containing protein [[Eubacterium] siraeum]MCM1455734.1 PH domain-containing protein [Bacteroides sp.]